jgi:hypothetical protein
MNHTQTSAVQESFATVLAYAASLRHDGWPAAAAKEKFIDLLKGFMSGKLPLAETEVVASVLRTFGLASTPTALLMVGNDQKWLQ